MGLDWDDIKGILGGFSGLIAPVLFFGLIAILKGKDWNGRLRIIGCAPQIIHAGVAVHTFIMLRISFGDNLEFAPHSKSLMISTGIKGVAGIIAIAWSILNTCIVRKRVAHTYKHRSRLFWYLYVIDLAFIASFATSIAYGRTYLPTNLVDCDDLPLQSRLLFSHVGHTLGESYDASCRRVLATQMMTIILMTAMVLQSCLLLLHVNFPASIRATLFFSVRFVRFLFCLDCRGRIRIRDIEKGPYTAKSEKRSLALLFQHNAIAATIASNLHYSDIVNVSLVSKELRGAVFSGSEKARGFDRLELLSVNSCEGEKRECWACARIVCSTCKVDRKDVLGTRTSEHMNKCRAICTRCYFLRTSVEPAPFSATLRPGDLSAQCYCSRKRDGTQEVELCPHCSTLASRQVTARREEREKEALQISLRRRIHCATCQKALPEGSVRWWICPGGCHECHWDGHDVKKRG